MAWDYIGQEGGFDPGYDDKAVRERLSAAIDGALGDADDTGVDIGMTVVNDLPARALLDASQEADLVVVGARGLGGFRRLALGSVSDQVLHYAGCPVAIVRPSADELTGRPERIVVGLDGSDGSQAAFRWALDEARARKAPVRLVHAWQPGSSVATSSCPPGPTPTPWPRSPRTSSSPPSPPRTPKGSPSSRSRCAAPSPRRCSGRPPTPRSWSSAPGRGGFAGLLLGSVSQQLARHSATPVVVVPHHA